MDERARRIAEIRAREAVATPGPWGRYGWPGIDGVITPMIGYMEQSPGLNLGSTKHTEPIARFYGYMHPVEANTDFAAGAREDIPWLLDQIEQLEEQVKKGAQATAILNALSMMNVGDELVVTDPRTEPGQFRRQILLSDLLRECAGEPRPENLN